MYNYTSNHNIMFNTKSFFVIRALSGFLQSLVVPKTFVVLYICKLCFLDLDRLEFSLKLADLWYWMQRPLNSAQGKRVKKKYKLQSYFNLQWLIYKVASYHIAQYRKFLCRCIVWIYSLCSIYNSVSFVSIQRIIYRVKNVYICNVRRFNVLQ